MFAHERACFAEITENEVMLLYNSLDAESNAIAQEYMQIHPGVVPCDLAFQYDLPDPVTGSMAPCKMTRFYISPCKFNEIFIDGPSAFTTCLNNNPQILMIVTTRGIPAAISNTTDPDTELDGGAQPMGGIYASVDSTLTRLGVGDVGIGDLDSAYDAILSPYPSTAGGFEDFLQQNSEYAPGDLFVVSRLDAATPDIDYDGSGGQPDNVDGVVGMLMRSQRLQVNQYAITVMFDTSPGGNGSPSTTYEEALATMWFDEICLYHEDTYEFVHGPQGPHGAGYYTPQTDGLFNSWPLLALQSFGAHHDVGTSGELIPEEYAGHYNAHPAGIFLSKESFNGWSLHAGEGSYPGDQGQVLDWTNSGGSFTIGYMHEPSASFGTIVDPSNLFEAFFTDGLTWGEAALRSMPKLGFFYGIIGDPLAKVALYNPDITGDRIVDEADRDIVTASFGYIIGDSQYDPAADINGDGIVNQADRLLIVEAYGRNCSHPPIEPTPNIGCGDLNGDNFVDQLDLDEFVNILIDLGYDSDCTDGDCGGECPLTEDYYLGCEGDLNGDAVLDELDYQKIISNLGLDIHDSYDLNGDGCIGIDDYTILANYLDEFDSNPCEGDSGYDPLFDLDCDGCVSFGDLGFLLGKFGCP